MNKQLARRSGDGLKIWTGKGREAFGRSWSGGLTSWFRHISKLAEKESGLATKSEIREGVKDQLYRQSHAKSPRTES